MARPEHRLSLGEVVTPLVALPRLEAAGGGGRLLVKDEGALPTGSFKARGLCAAVSKARELGLRKLAMPTNGNAGSALAAYCARGGLESLVVAPADTPALFLEEAQAQGAAVRRVDGLIHDCGARVKREAAEGGWFDVSTLKEPYRIEGKKTMGLELAEQLGWRLPDLIVYPTGGGTGLVGMWKAFQELRELGWLEGGGALPRMVAVQVDTCAPIVRAFERGDEFAEPWVGARPSLASGIRVPVAVGDFLVLRALRESGGCAVAVGEDQLAAARDEVARREGLLLCPEGAAAYAAYRDLAARGLARPGETAVLFNCASGLKYPLPPVLPPT